jgi:ABC-type glycerol-3-phosphate transport system substrate-binding protein
MKFPAVLMWILLLTVGLVLPASAVPSDKPVTVTIAQGYNPNRPEDATTAALIELMREDPQLNIRPWGGIQLPGGGGWRTPFMMSLAGQTAPDIYYVWFHILQNDIGQNFVHPLNEWIGEDRDGNGQVDDDEAIWPEWKNVPPLWRQVATRDGKVYGIPVPDVSYFGLIYRKDLAANAGLDPEKPPATWEEFWYWCQKLTRPPGRGRRRWPARLRAVQLSLVLAAVDAVRRGLAHRAGPGFPDHGEGLCVPDGGGCVHRPGYRREPQRGSLVLAGQFRLL